MASHDNPMTSNLRIPSFIVAFLRVLRWVVYYAQGRRQLREIGGAKLKSGGQSWKPALNLTQTFIIPELDWGEVSVKIRWSQKKKKKSSSPKSKGFFRPKSQIQTVFPAKNRWSPKKKVFAGIRRLFLAEITNSNGFSGQKQVISKKKVFAEIQRLFLAEVTNLNGFSAQKQQPFPPKKYRGGARNKLGGKNGGAMPPCWRRAWLCFHAV